MKSNSCWLIAADPMFRHLIAENTVTNRNGMFFLEPAQR